MTNNHPLKQRGHTKRGHTIYSYRKKIVPVYKKYLVTPV